MKAAIYTLSILSTSALSAVTSLSVGDLTVIRFNGRDLNVAPGVQDFSFVTWKNLEAGTTINITDKGVTSAGVFSDKNDLGVFTWEVTQFISAGTVINIEFAPDESTYNSSLGSLSTNGQMLDFNAVGDQVFLFQGTLANPALIFGLNASIYQIQYHTPEGWQEHSAQEQYSTLPISLENTERNTESVFGNFAFFAEFAPTNGHYTGPRTGLTEEEYKQAIADRSNWTFILDAKLEKYDPTAFELPYTQPNVPEPAHTGILLGILAITIGAWKKRHAG